MKKALPILLIALAACRQTYTPPAIAHPPDYLVVEGFINTNKGDSTVFSLSHTFKLDTNSYIPELGATVTVEGSDKSSVKLLQLGQGRYGALLSGLDNNLTYRLHIITARGKQYASDYVPLLVNPPIDSISWKRLDNEIHRGIQLYANTHDPQNKVQYWRWEFQETWEFHSAFFASVRYIPGTGLVPYAPNAISTCWRSKRSTGILLATSTQLSQALIHEAPLVLIPLGSQQITVRYSILVKQYPLTQDAFNWWRVMQNNTEQIGSIFGVQPSANKGNIHCLADTTEMVIGYVGGGNPQSKRAFITNAQVQPWVFDSGCEDKKAPPDSVAFYYSIGYLPWNQEISPPVVHLAHAACVDCTLSGYNTPPSWW